MLSLSSMLFVGHQKLKRGRPWGWQGLLWGRNARTDLGCPEMTSSCTVSVLAKSEGLAGCGFNVRSPRFVNRSLLDCITLAAWKSRNRVFLPGTATTCQRAALCGHQYRALPASECLCVNSSIPVCAHVIDVTHFSHSACDHELLQIHRPLGGVSLQFFTTIW